MTLAVLASILTLLYPWNVELGGYATAGDWSEGESYRAETAYVGFDRWKKDYARLVLRRSRVDDDWYRQQSAVLSVFRWWRPELKVGADLGVVDGEVSAGSMGAWLLGARAEGVAGPLGYAVRYHYLDGRGDVAMLGEQSDVSSAHNLSLALRRTVGPFLVEPGLLWNQPTGEQNLAWTVAVSGWVSDHLMFRAVHGFGRARGLVDTDALTVDLSRNYSTAWYEIGLTARLSPHVYAHLSGSRTDYEPPGSLWPYQATYVTLGMNLRY